MTDSIEFPDATARCRLPLLHVAQAQKELFVNEAFLRADAYVQAVSQGFAASPPENPQEGDCWIVTAPASDIFTGYADHLACWQQGQWNFLAPFEGLQVFCRSNRVDLRFEGEWKLPIPVTPPAGGLTIDSEARAAIGAIIACLQQSGALPTN